MARQLSRSDNLIHQFDSVLRTLVPGAAQPRRPSPALAQPEGALDDEQRRHVAGLMRINHTGEVCAQALYQGQGLTAKLGDTRERMEEAAAEEVDHLSWCDQRLQELDGRTSYLNPAFYAASFGLGALAGAIGDRISLGFVAATEEQVGHHLEAHLRKLPIDDKRSRAVLEQMRIDEAQHERMALESGGSRFPLPVKWGMRLVSKVMTKSVYRL
ncbi:2-polyprenyl-3-methyl-6-methoxy-1,4-benzoquinone monooxygenase [Salinicola endophyticus]|uniref:3-demethoxyubiquinol 3-hydroxylase n=1 Tax=Salinicola endophyticus TaxID=1949083 RepID=A0ABY8FD85_9GAMM|nr:MULTISPECIES: 2-polyprenyl-3-methyl-6-methoxy-1,4-benzoquinone monooxygenase [Salinicola]WFF40512.1 2-polyprenyl-3-methyl-6-methoxy-1,4-benzoquinone monooxygenase [Salinicola endophyticus]